MRTAQHRHGALVVDTQTSNLGHVMSHEGSCIRQRPMAGGREWDADPARIRPAIQAERRTALRERARTLNAAGSKGTFA
ncbi:hypothetical protein [Streptomyces sp. NPDC048419]|uniref:hypothetical protein n=1 Tax=Streptomyces sp. NPDC048419 TaxID=3365547 RepID=UPI003712EB9F